MRLFLAIRFNSYIENALLNVQKEMKSKQVTGNYSRCQDLHLTLAFIGEYPHPDLVLKAIQQVSVTPFPLSLSGSAGAFDNLWWVGLKKNPALTELVLQLRKTLSDYQIPFDQKPFKPHITLIREAKVPFGENYDIRKIQIPNISMIVDRLFLMRSQRENGKLFYTELGCVSASKR